VLQAEAPAYIQRCDKSKSRRRRPSFLLEVLYCAGQGTGLCCVKMAEFVPAEFVPRNVKDVPAEDFIKTYAAHLKSNDKVPAQRTYKYRPETYETSSKAALLM
jgi:hypothetical protein